MKYNLKKINTIFLILFLLLCNHVESLGATNLQTLRRSSNSLGLIGLWSFDGADVVNGRIMDRSGMDIHGTPLNIATSTFYTIGKIGQGVSMDGVDDCVRMGDVSTYDFDEFTSFTVAGWYRRADNATTMFITKKGGSGNTIAGFYYNIITTNGGLLEARVSDGTNQVVHSSGTVTGINNGAWHHIAVVVNRSAQTINSYIDGRAETSSSISTVGSLSSTNHFAIGARSSTGICSTPSGASYDDVRVYNRALSSNEISALYNSGTAKIKGTLTRAKVNTSFNSKVRDGLIGLFSFDGADIVNGVAQDRSGQNNHGTFSNIATSTFYSIGKIGQGINFDGSNDGLNFSGISLPSSYTASMWIKTTMGGDTDYATLYANSDSSSGFLIRKSTRKALLYFSFTQYPINGTITANEWTHLTVSNNNGTASIYVNGVFDSTVNSTPSITVVSSGSDSSGEDLQGSMDELRFYNRALSAQEIKQLYNMGR